MLLSIRLLCAQESLNYSIHFDQLANRWDEAMPLGNGMLGTLIWEKEGKLRFSLDRADLWDERKAFNLEHHNFKWVKNRVDSQDYKSVQEWGDMPYEASPYPTKLPAAALELNVEKWGQVLSNTLDIAQAINTIVFDSGVQLITYVHATEPFGSFEIQGGELTEILPEIAPHAYVNLPDDGVAKNSVDGQSLSRLGYQQGGVKREGNSLLYRQVTYEGRYYEVLIKWQKIAVGRWIGLWTVSNNKPAKLPDVSSASSAKSLAKHLAWWEDFWSKSHVSLPDKTLEKQYYLEMYKLGATARKGAPAITLQAIWTADNGGLPPWKGDFHNDLNTQLSYWPAYTGNRLSEAETFTDWLWKIRKENLRYTKQYFQVEGLNVPGVVTLQGAPMGGWIQYSLSPTVGAWTAQHFYWQWKYSMDQKFLKKKAYPYITQVATYLRNITEIKNGQRYLPLSSSPEYHDNAIEAWFKDWTNYDLALAKFIFKAAAELSLASGRKNEALDWERVEKELPAYSADTTGLLVSLKEPMEHSHRHFSPYMAIYPLTLLDVRHPEEEKLIKNSLRHLEKLGTRAWVGYSFSWIACMYARAKEADSAVLNLQKFANNFCSINSFHLNGDQKGGQYSAFTYRPFTLEGNFAFAQGIHELLLQSKDGYVEIFPAVPQAWQDVSFRNLRAEGGFLISAEKKKGRYKEIRIRAEKGGVIRLKLPTETFKMADEPGKERIRNERGFTTIQINSDETIKLIDNHL
ncbi:glycoside hydrolase family 95-like protein [Olivibacter sp. SDN3]|uniref:glycosyl hydrolase family 95 catalytic domain-containing protein n=1 Tax=Olivibacter sp. SDN3 TaxID=2764720 RepID=UPI0021063E28|nr:glycoside hydrolase N-terminal domain-containing protein [Olivibacter sp. SDN3]